MSHITVSGRGGRCRFYSSMRSANAAAKTEAFYDILESLPFRHLYYEEVISTQVEENSEHSFPRVFPSQRFVPAMFNESKWYL